MKEIYQELEKPLNSTHIYSKASGENRAKIAINGVFEKIYHGNFDLSETKMIFLQIASGKKEITIDEIGEVNDKIQNVLGPTLDIVMEVIEKDIDEEIELQLLFTKLKVNTKNIKTSKIFNSAKTDVKSLPIYFLEDEYSTEEVSEMISFLSDLYKEIGGDGLRIKGFSKIQVKNVMEPIFY